MGKIVVLGAGESGVGAALLAKKNGRAVFVSDGSQIKTQYKSILTENNIPFEEGGHTKESFFDAEIVIKSPGIPPWVPLVKDFVERGIEVISEIEYAYRFAKAPIIAITGSNGKTTSSSLIHHLLVENGVKANLGGNIGVSFALQVATLPIPEVYVLEVSSFQLDDCVHFKPNVALLLNITPDHLDRYDGKMEAYAASKFRISLNQNENDVFIFNREDPWTAWGLKELKRSEASKVSFGLNSGGNAWRNEGKLMMQTGDSFEIESLKILGPHNQLNALAALLALEAFGTKVSPDALSSFDPIPHRLEPVSKIKGVHFINDSKATNVDAVKYALEAMDSPIIWMAGGVDKGNDYQELKELVVEKVKAILVLGANDEKFRTEFEKPVFTLSSMAEAIRKSLELAESGDTVLLSPACASFDLFKNYEDRGEQFRNEVLSNQE
ncbi:MAG: UDP-N-acetylmuramoyl-L-alanine--D-glutamate ligase [Bacteroidia bacterium]|nr:UDP-N-acetylmuramoyl-L-alanine--D-glutamate ligase [Bacteroidia bacterium]